ncbi:MFS transporter, partial [Streptomyces sp. W16]|nr:MFS transporter [Streptomyces sp. W16]
GAAVGLGLPCVLIAAFTAVQREVPGPLLGRATATANTLLFTPNVIGLAAGAAMVELADFRPLLIATGLALLTTGVWLGLVGTGAVPAFFGRMAAPTLFTRSASPVPPASSPSPAPTGRHAALALFRRRTSPTPPARTMSPDQSPASADRTSARSPSDANPE